MSTVGWLTIGPIKSFLSEIYSEQSEIIRTITKLAYDLGMKIVVEGVETAGQADFVIDALGDRIQDCYFRPPLSRDKLLIYLTGLPNSQ